MSNNTQTHGIGFFGLLTIVFITLKLCNVIDWSWWWVLCSLWIGFVILGGVIAFGFTIAMLVEIFGTKKGKRRR